MKQQWQQLEDRYSQITKREKLIIFFSGCGVLIYVFVMLFIEPAWSQYSQQQQELDILKTQIVELEQSSTELKQALRIDINLPLNEQISQLKQRLESVDANLEQISAELVNTEQMTQLLQDMLAQSDRVKLVSLHAMPAVDLMAVNQAAADKHPAMNVSLYQQNLHMVIEGRYQDIYEFLHSVESLPWQFNWQNFQYQVKQYPSAQLSIEIATLSLTEDVLKL
ncbi:MSHA biogenesis protein MshJ [Catenovulum agarivorans DS-2]|uniref:MSHA biogenesis protein MshJ n=1 Tax=Catenovulum agarivorans DS-2 TaxID=1328313 RepID=W7Q9T7_9ALTE|nr:type II secretion system protein GspM [Catenovulum agarivorans]EWH08741.1 MSHA biogenesis protein MshJ [Catenovulum agarivorans DS-2]